MDYATKVHKFPLMHPMGPISGTHLHDYNLEMIKKRSDKKLVIGDCFGYYGASGWWYLFDNENVINMNNRRVDMEKDKIELDMYRSKGTPFEELRKIYAIPKATNKKYMFYAETEEDKEEKRKMEISIHELKHKTSFESTISRYNSISSKLNVEILKDIKQMMINATKTRNVRKNGEKRYSVAEIDKIFNDILKHPANEHSKSLEKYCYGYGGVCSENSDDLKHPLCSLYVADSYFKNRTLYCITDPIVNIKQIGRGMLINIYDYEEYKKNDNEFELLLSKLQQK